MFSACNEVIKQADKKVTVVIMYYRKGGQGYHFSTSNFENTQIMKMQLAAPRSFAMCFAPSCFAALQPWHHGGSQPLQPPLSLASNPALAPT